MSRRGKTVVPFPSVEEVSRGYERFGRACMGLEPEICDVVRLCDLAEFVWLAEAEGELEGTLQLVLKDLTKRAKDLKALYYQLHKSA
jgi:hypothetical protein